VPCSQCRCPVVAEDPSEVSIKLVASLVGLVGQVDEEGVLPSELSIIGVGPGVQVVIDDETSACCDPALSIVYVV
jgi:hypothetical protein